MMASGSPHYQGHYAYRQHARTFVMTQHAHSRVFLTPKSVFKLIHACIGKQQRGVIVRNET